MKQKEGFTIIELLSVIAVIAIIALITIPVVNTMIKNSRKSAFETSVNSTIKTIDLYLLDKYEGRFKNEKIFNISPSGIVEVKNGVNGDFLKFEGTIKGSGQIKVTGDGKYFVRFYDGEYCAKKQYSDKNIIITKGNCN